MVARHICFAWALALAAGCSGPSARVTIGAVVSEAGMLAASGQGSLQAAQLAADEINAAGGVLGGSFVLAFQNDDSDPATIPGIASSLLDRSMVPAVFCCDGSGLTIPMASFAVPAHVVQISGASTAAAITTLADNDLVFRTCPSDALQGQLIAARALARGFTQMAVIYVQNPYGMGLAQGFVTSFTMHGGTVTFNQPIPTGQPSYVQLLSDIFATQPQAILLVAYPLDGAQVIRDYNAGFAFLNAFWYFTDALEVSAFVTAVGESNFTFAHEGTHSGVPAGSAYATYASAYLARYGEPDDPGTYSPNAYDAIYLLALAIEQAGKADSKAIHDHLRAVANPPGMVIGPGQLAAAKQAIKRGVKINYEGASGSVDFDAHGDVTGLYDIWQVEQGQITVVERSVAP
jgi:ABC-type branched-subunit amino acid transport system substrate-binding protein